MDIFPSETKPEELQCIFSYQRKDHSCWMQEETRDRINYYYHRLYYIVPRGLSRGEGATMLLYKSAVSHSSCLKERRLHIGKMEKH